MSLLDRVFCSTDFDLKFPLATCRALPVIILLSFGTLVRGFCFLNLDLSLKSGGSSMMSSNMLSLISGIPSLLGIVILIPGKVKLEPSGKNLEAGVLT
mgnify:CR=1 FL=1